MPTYAVRTWGPGDFSFVEGCFVLPTVPNGHTYQAYGVGGTTGFVEPTWPTGGGTVVDGSQTWKDLGTGVDLTIHTWQPLTVYAEATLVQPPAPNSHVYVPLPFNAGTSGAWPHAGQANPWTPPYNGTDDLPAGADWPTDTNASFPLDLGVSGLDGSVYWTDIGLGGSAPTPTVPAAPTLNSATPGAGAISLSWTPGSDGGSSVTAAKVYRGSASGAETLLATLGAVTTYVDHPPLGTWFYKVSEVNVVGESALSNELSAAPDSFTWTNDGPQLLVKVAAGLNPGSFTLARTLGLGAARASFDPLVLDEAPQTQLMSVRIEQHGVSAVTEIYSVDIDSRPMPSSLRGENS